MDKPYSNLIGQLLEEIDDPDYALNESHGHQPTDQCDGLSDCSHHEHTNSPSHSAAASHNSTAALEASDFPTKVCTFHLNGLKGVGQGCLRINCSYFHGTEEQLAELRQRAAYEKEHGITPGVNGYPSVKRVKRSLADTDLGDKRAIVCLAYLSNSCRRPGCRFLHLPPNIRPLPIAVCDRNLRGVCTLRHRCRFFHGKQEDLSRMHAEGVTMYNPYTFEAHDPSATIDELMKLQTQTTIPAEMGTGLPLPPSVASSSMVPQQPLYYLVQVPPFGTTTANPYPSMVGASPFMLPMLPPFGYPLQLYPTPSIAHTGPPLPPYTYATSQLPGSSKSRFPSAPVSHGYVTS